MFLFGKNARFGGICRKLVEQADDAIVVVNSHHDIVLFNRGAERIFGYVASEITGHPLAALLQEKSGGQHESLIDEYGIGAVIARDMGQRQQQVMALRKDGVEFLARVEILAIEENGEKYYAAIMRDISQDKKTEDELLRLASTDPLTGAYNRREFTAIAEREALRSNRYNRPLSILMLDLDHFKRLNDTYGHAAGDKALQRFTTLCTSTLRNVDIFGRWGGEEFVALLPETDIEGASVIGERLRRLVSESVLTFNGHKINFTASIGISQFKSGEVAIDTPLSRADSAVYDAKKSGRNRISVYRN
jgi:diguanylate cyclase (GGDEF)-like protein/PAS domain S-box-containing protein